MLPLTIARLKRNSNVLGPGCRAVIWTHGCSKGCPHCIAEEMNAAPPQLEYTATTLYEWVKETGEIEGITLSGGEPFEQDIEALETFLQLVKNDPRRLSVMCYTGRLMTELLDNNRTAGILRYVDILVDGAYIHGFNEGHKWRGSSNQKFYSLNERYADIVAEAENDFNRGIEIELTANMQFELTGIPQRGFMQNLEQKLQEKGYSLSLGNN